MKIHNKNLRKSYWMVWGSLLLISIIDLVLANLDTGFNQYFWGYLFVLNIVLVALVYFLFGKPFFALNSEGDVLEISTGISFLGLDRDFVKINRQNLVGFSIEDHGLRKELTLKVLQADGVARKAFTITWLSKGKVEKLKKHLNDLVIRDTDP
ncbi:MAG: hypothetical protein LPK46_05590, partial [Bacteroidota bacterium]|nr:hypothetical protein [Bacteroidota bacterium]MDX5505595.1 hypothetical protein [Bacteroidota bacterium]